MEFRGDSEGGKTFWAQTLHIGFLFQAYEEAQKRLKMAEEDRKAMVSAGAWEAMINNARRDLLTEEWLGTGRGA